MVVAVAVLLPGTGSAVVAVTDAVFVSTVPSASDGSAVAVTVTDALRAGRECPQWTDQRRTGAAGGGGAQDARRRGCRSAPRRPRRTGRCCAPSRCRSARRPGVTVAVPVLVTARSALAAPTVVVADAELLPGTGSARRRRHRRGVGQHRPRSASDGSAVAVTVNVRGRPGGEGTDGADQRRTGAAGGGRRPRSRRPGCRSAPRRPRRTGRCCAPSRCSSARRPGVTVAVPVFVTARSALAAPTVVVAVAELLPGTGSAVVAVDRRGVGHRRSAGQRRGRPWRSP